MIVLIMHNNYIKLIVYSI